jgi:hypothetical protein
MEGAGADAAPSAEAAKAPIPAVSATFPNSEIVPAISFGATAPESTSGMGACFAWRDAHGKSTCKSGCELSQHPTLDLTARKFEALMEDYGSPDRAIADAALDELIYYGPQARRLFAESGAAIGTPRRKVLEEELAVTRALVSLRVVDERGRTPIRLEPVSVLLDARHAFNLTAEPGVLPPESSGTVKRVGRDHVWVRC